MIKLLRLLLALFGLVFIVMLAVDNRGIVEIVFWPLPFRYHMPLYAVFLIGLVAGALLGGAGALALQPRPSVGGAGAAPQGQGGRVSGAAARRSARSRRCWSRRGARPSRLALAAPHA